MTSIILLLTWNEREKETPDTTLPMLHRSQSFHLHSKWKQSIIARDVGILVRFSEPPLSTTIQIFRYHGANFCALAVSFVESAGSRSNTRSIPA
jgi:hypothetical protein